MNRDVAVEHHQQGYRVYGLDAQTSLNLAEFVWTESQDSRINIVPAPGSTHEVVHYGQGVYGVEDRSFSPSEPISLIGNRTTTILQQTISELKLFAPHNRFRVSETEHTGGNLWVNESTFINGRLSNSGFTINLPTHVTWGNGRSLGVPISLGGTVGKDGLSINVSAAGDLIWIGSGANVNLRFNAQELAALEVRAHARALNNRAGVGAGVPLSPWESLRLYTFSQVKDGNKTTYAESGVHMRMGTAYAIAFAFYIAYAMFQGMDPQTAVQPLIEFWKSLGAASAYPS